MKRTIFLATLIIALAVLGAATGAKAQVTIGSMDEPKATLDVRKGGTKADGIIAPVLTGNELKGNDSKYGTDQTGAIVYVTAAASPTTTKTANVTAAGYYYFDGSVWQSLKGTDGGGGGTTYSAGTNISILGSAIHALDTATVANEGLQKSVSGMTQTIGIADGGVTTVKIADNAVTSAKILDGTITSADLSADLFSAVKKDTIVGNEVTDAANATLTRSGSGKDADPYKLAVNPTATADSIAKIFATTALKDTLNNYYTGGGGVTTYQGLTGKCVQVTGTTYNVVGDEYLIETKGTTYVTVNLTSSALTLTAADAGKTIYIVNNNNPASNNVINGTDSHNGTVGTNATGRGYPVIWNGSYWLIAER